MNKQLNIALLVGLAAMSTINVAHADSNGRGFYLGAFVGAGRTDNQTVEQSAVAYKKDSEELMHDNIESPWELFVDVKGNTKRGTLGLGGVHVGYEWAANAFNIKPAAELEAFYIGADQESNLRNPAQENGVYTSSGTSEHDGEHVAGDISTYHSIAPGVHQFANKMNTNMGLLMANGIFTYETGLMFKPYVGGGIGLAYVRMTNATSYQTGPGGLELINGSGSDPVNHFNSKTRDSDVAFAAQAKVGLRAEFDSHWSAFAEYRYLRVASSDFTFGDTSYPGDHVATSSWKLKNDSMDFHMGLAGISYAF